MTKARIFINGEEVTMKTVKEWCGELFAEEIKNDIATSEPFTTIIYGGGEIEVYC